MGLVPCIGQAPRADLGKLTLTHSSFWRSLTCPRQLRSTQNWCDQATTLSVRKSSAPAVLSEADLYKLIENVCRTGPFEAHLFGLIKSTYLVSLRAFFAELSTIKLGGVLLKDPFQVGKVIAFCRTLTSIPFRLTSLREGLSDRSVSFSCCSTPLRPSTMQLKPTCTASPTQTISELKMRIGNVSIKEIERPREKEEVKWGKRTGWVWVWFKGAQHE